MTRETKIGLLVGLAFIIVIGILLSDHLTSSNEPPPAKLAVAGDTIRSAVTTPGVTGSLPQPAQITPAVAPHQTVPTQNDLTPRPQPVQPAPVQVAVGGPSNTQQPIPVTSSNPVQYTRAPETPVATNIPDMRSESGSNTPEPEPVISKAPPVVTPPTPVTPEPTHTFANTGSSVADALQEAARQHGEELVQLGGAGNSGNTNSGNVLRPGTSGMKQYVALEGESLGKIAAKFFGTNTKAARDAIINANPSLKQNANMILAGKSYNIPASIPQSSGQSVAPSATATALQTIQAPPAPVQPVTPVTTETWYTVKEGDSLWKIATEQCGGAAAIPTIKELNKESLKNDTVVLNTKLRLPSKQQVTTAN